MKYTKKMILSKLLFLWLIIFIAFPSNAEQSLKLGVLAFRPKEQALEQWKPLALYLTAQLNRNVEVSTYSYPELETAVSENKLDIVLANPAFYILLRHRYSLSAPLVTQITRKGTHHLTAFGGVIFTRSDKNTIKSLADLDKKRVAITKTGSLGGYKMQAYELFNANLPPIEKDQQVITGMPHDLVVNSVLSGQADAGFVRSGVLEAMADEGKIELKQFKIINSQNLPSYPFKVSTRVYPEWPLAVMPRVDDNLSRQITIALLSLPENNFAAIKAKIYGFTVPANYIDVETLLRRLRLEPFNISPDITIGDLWSKYFYWIIAIGLLTFSLFIIGLRLLIQNRLVQKSKQAIQVSEQQLNYVINGAQLGYWDWDYKSGKHIVNEQWLSMLGLFPHNITNHISDWDKLIHPDDRQAILDIIKAHINSGTAYISEFRMKHADGHWVWIQRAGAVVQYDKTTHEAIRLCGTHQDISLRKKTEEKLKLLASVFSDAHEGITITDTNKNIVDVNPAFYEITGYSRNEVIGKNPKILSSGKQDPTFYADMWQQINKNSFWKGELWNRKKNGEIYAISVSISSIEDKNHNIINYISVFTDITNSKQQQEKLHLMAHYDVLTGLPNRVLFVDRFRQAIAHSKRSTNQLAICFLDLDKFKPINDNYGHEVGDELLVEVAKRIKLCIREEDTVSRQGGDEFALLLNDINSITQVKQTLKRIHDTLSQPYLINNNTHNISASSGITIYPLDKGDIDTLLRHADQAMYQAKQTGRNRYFIFNTEQDQEVTQKHQQLNKIQQALKMDEFELYYQPKVNMLTGDVIGAEALIRWNHPEKGLIPPLDFLPLIEETELEVLLGSWVINEALNQLSNWKKKNIELEVSVNISSYHLQTSSFLTTLNELLAKYPHVSTEYLQLEILESSSLGDLKVISSIIKTCINTLGLNIALDDFGTGYSSLTHLRNLAAKTIKIDQTFVRDILDDPDDFSIIEGVIGLANSFNRKVIAEGVETVEQGLMLLIMGCNNAQGYGISRPMSSSAFQDWLSNYTPNKQWLEYAKNIPKTQEEKQKELFRLILDKWQQSFEKNILSSPDSIIPEQWPILKSTKCHCGILIKQKHLIGNKSQQQLKEIHNNMHNIANDLLKKYQEGEVENARNGLKDLNLLVDKMLSSFTHCK